MEQGWIELWPWPVPCNIGLSSAWPRLDKHLWKRNAVLNAMKQSEFTEFTDASMPSQTILAWVSTGFRRITPTITTAECDCCYVTLHSFSVSLWTSVVRCCYNQLREFLNINWQDFLKVSDNSVDDIWEKFKLIMYDGIKQIKLECGPMPNLMVALPNIGGALCSTP